MGAQDDYSYRLLEALAEELKLPLLQIARMSELEDSRDIKQTAEIALRLIDGYVLGMQSEEQVTLRLEPLTMSSILYETAEALKPLARRNGCEVRVDIGTKLAPVMGDRRLLQHAFTILGYELLHGLAETSKPTLTFAMHRSNSQVVAGVFSDSPGLTTDAFRRAKALMGVARQTLPGGLSANGAGIFIADCLLHGMASSFRVARHNKQLGLAASLLPSHQLQLV